MIHEYALEPELVAGWHNSSDYRYFIEQFGFNRSGTATGRVVAHYPKKWEKRVWDAFSANSGQSANSFDSRRRIETFLRGIKETLVRRPNIRWDDQRPWLENAEQENTRRPFHAILARDNPRDNFQVVRGDDELADNPPPLWRVHPETTVSRQAKAMATHLEPMLRCATKIFFVDPHFRASESRFRNPLREFLRIICDGSRTVTLEYHASASYANAPSWDHFLRECQDHLPRLIPRGFKLTVRRWKNRTGGQRSHNRYILTDIGGVLFGHGLDEGDGSDDIFRLSRETYRKWCNDYGHSGSNPAFDLERDIVITGH